CSAVCPCCPVRAMMPSDPRKLLILSRDCIQLISGLLQRGIALMTTATEKRQRLRERLAAPGMRTAPGIFDMISARMADRMGFDVLYMTGYGTVASYLGLPD